MGIMRARAYSSVIFIRHVSQALAAANGGLEWDKFALMQTRICLARPALSRVQARSRTRARQDVARAHGEVRVTFHWHRKHIKPEDTRVSKIRWALRITAREIDRVNAINNSAWQSRLRPRVDERAGAREFGRVMDALG